MECLCGSSKVKWIGHIVNDLSISLQEWNDLSIRFESPKQVLNYRIAWKSWNKFASHRAIYLHQVERSQCAKGSRFNMFLSLRKNWNYFARRAMSPLNFTFLFPVLSYIVASNFRARLSFQLRVCHMECDKDSKARKPTSGIARGEALAR